MIERIQRLQRLETVVFNMDKIVTGEKDNPILPNFIAGDRLLMIVHGQVVAGIDFSRMKTSDIKVQGKEVRVHLPNPQILITRLDNARTKVYSRSTGLLVRVDPNLETQVGRRLKANCCRKLRQAESLPMPEITPAPP